MLHYHNITFNSLSLYNLLYMQIINSLKGMSTIRLSNNVKAKLVKIGAKLSLKDGKNRSMEDIIKLIIEHYESDKTGEIK